MVRLNKNETEVLAKLVVRSFSKVKGACLDYCRLALPKDKQDTLTRLLKGNEQGVRQALFQALEELELTEPIEQEELARLK